jgi:hypothetical protein
MNGIRTFLKTIQPPFSFYWRPREPNFEGLDAVIRDHDTAWGVQYTIRAKHGSVTEGLTQVRKDMNHKHKRTSDISYTTFKYNCTTRLSATMLG